MKHTKLPWHVGMKPGPMIYGPKGEQIADMLEANGEADLFPYVEENRANAAFIVRACNAHEDLVAALEKFVSAGYGNSTDFRIQGEAYDIAYKALGKAKAE